MADLIQFLDVMLSPAGILTMVAIFCAGGFAGAALVGRRG
jgi:hypothetical protein